jgi:N utilization substance protein A
MVPPLCGLGDKGGGKNQGGTKMAVVTINPKDKGIAIGKNGKNAERLRFLAKRYFDIQNISIT